MLSIGEHIHRRTGNRTRAKLYHEKLDAGLSAYTVNYVHRTLSKVLEQARADGLVPRNVSALREGISVLPTAFGVRT